MKNYELKKAVHNDMDITIAITTTDGEYAAYFTKSSLRKEFTTEVNKFQQYLQNKGYTRKW